MVPWGRMRKQLLVLDHIKVTGVRYLDESSIRRRSGLQTGQDLLSLDPTRIRQLVLLEPRLESATVHRHGLRGIEIKVVERVPALMVEHGEPWEMDAEGVLLEPLQTGVVADVPMLVGPDLTNRLAGSLVQTPQVKRGLAWTTILNDNALRLTGQVSEVDVTDPRVTRLVMMNGVRVVAPAWPNGARQLSGLRATLADLHAKGMMPREVDVRFKDQIVVRGARLEAPTASTTTSRES
jgi:cell division septal protein FtsQ